MDKKILHAHLDNSESCLLALYAVPSVSGHSLHKGTPREMFVREFLGEHLPLDFAIGTGELIDHRTLAGGKRHQHDIVIYGRSFPRIHVGGGINAFMCESVEATIEVKSTLKDEDVLQAAKAAQAAKELQGTGGLAATIGPIRNYLLAYDSRGKMDSVFAWIAEAYRDLKISDAVPQPNSVRVGLPCPAIDGIFVLGKGFCLYENNVGFLDHPARVHAHPGAMWTVMSAERGALAMLYTALLGTLQGADYRFLAPWHYLSSVSVHGLKFGRIDLGRHSLEADVMETKSNNPPSTRCPEQSAVHTNDV